jgi:ribosomal protein S18 acetylase RimI-like enzyme
MFLLTHPVLARTRRVTEADWPLVDVLHRRCSPESLLRRWGRMHLTRRDLVRLLAHNTCWITTTEADGTPIALSSVGAVSREEGVVDLGLLVADAHHCQGIGIALARHAAEHARAHGTHTLSAYTEASNAPVLRLLDRLGPARHTRDGAYLEVRIPLVAVAARCADRPP